MDILDLHEELKNLKFNGLTLNLDERFDFPFIPLESS